MGLNIKNERVHELAREAARRTGKTQTGAIQLALEKLLEETDSERRHLERGKRIDSAIADFHANLTPDAAKKMRQAEADLFDDEFGLPR